MYIVDKSQEIKYLKRIPQELFFFSPGAFESSGLKGILNPRCAPLGELSEIP